MPMVTVPVAFGFAKSGKLSPEENSAVYVSVFIKNQHLRGQSTHTPASQHQLLLGPVRTAAQYIYCFFMSKSAKITITEGEAEFYVPAAGKPCKTWYKVIGDLDDPNHRRPLVLVHGGPGASHHYMQPIAKLWETDSTPIVLYDQIGNGNSTHLQEKTGDGSFWTEELFRNELENLLKHLKIEDDYNLLGHSWGGRLIAIFATYKPKGLKKLVISDSAASMELWIRSANKIRLTLPQDVQAILSKHEEAGTTDSKEYEEANQVFYKRHFYRLDVWPKELLDSFGAIS